MRLGKEIRKDFPIYSRHSGAGGLCYLDSASTSLKPVPVIEAMRRYSVVILWSKDGLFLGV
mgnify:FL=1